jgi:thiamine biosynthesis protein ThiS
VREPLRITLNGRQAEAEEGASVEAFVQERFGARAVAIEYNGEPLSRERFQGVELSDGDRLEVVQLVGGG